LNDQNHPVAIEKESGWATELVSRRGESLVHPGIQTMDHQAHSLVTILTTIPRACNIT